MRRTAVLLAGAIVHGRFRKVFNDPCRSQSTKTPPLFPLFIRNTVYIPVSASFEAEQFATGDYSMSDSPACSGRDDHWHARGALKEPPYQTRSLLVPTASPFARQLFTRSALVPPGWREAKVRVVRKLTRGLPLLS